MQRVWVQCPSWGTDIPHTDYTEWPKKKKKLKMVNFMLHVLRHTHKINIPKCASKEMEFFN